MFKLLLRSGLVACVMTLAACGLFGGPSNKEQQMCFGSAGKVPLSSVVDLLESRGVKLSWEHVDGAQWILRLRNDDRLSGQVTEGAMEVSFQADSESGKHCGPGKVMVQRVAIDGVQLPWPNVHTFYVQLGRDAYRTYFPEDEATENRSSVRPSIPPGAPMDGNMSGEEAADSANDVSPEVGGAPVSSEDAAVEPRLSRDFRACMSEGDAAQGVSSALGGCYLAEGFRQDVILNQTYMGALASLPEHGRRELVQTQREWTAARKEMCEREASAFAGGTHEGVALQACFLNETVKRIIQLERRS
jgi:uncharacterized protein YecT (DUF1311 family)